MNDLTIIKALKDHEKDIDISIKNERVTRARVEHLEKGLMAHAALLAERGLLGRLRWLFLGR